MIELFFVFIYVGLFTIGGGMAAIPLIQQAVVLRGWLTLADFTSMVGIAQSTPGPIGINVATYVGFEQAGILGAIVASIGFILPSFVIVSFLASLLRKYRKSELVVNWFYFIKASIIGLIGYALVSITLNSVLSFNSIHDIPYIAFIILIALFVIFKILKKYPWLVILIGAGLGMLFL
ncbi:MAG: chromate transporter [Candidatus Izemoplasmatales bacterium]|jgi:chromate transporter|nr:chromate transporter [Candidatus Izemoplasmatales bacterium]